MDYKLIQRITLEDIRASHPKTIFYGVNTCWWTHDPKHLNNTRNFSPSMRGSLPCDSRGGVLMQTDDVEGFLHQAEEGAARYGPFGLKTFLASHHLNCVAIQSGVEAPWCFSRFSDYTTILHAQGGRLALE